MKKFTLVTIIIAFAISISAQTSKDIPNLSLNPYEAIELTVQPTTDFQSFYLNPVENIEIASDYPLRAYYNQNYYFRFQMPEGKDVSVHLNYPDEDTRASMASYRVYHDEFIMVGQSSMKASGQAFKIRNSQFESGQQVLVRLWFSDEMKNAQIGLALTSDQPLSASKNIVIDQTYTSDQLVNDVFMGGNTTTTNVVFTGDTISIGQYEGSISGTDFGQGLIMTTGDATLAPGPDVGTSEGVANEEGTDPDLDALIPGYDVYDACVLEFDFIATDNYVNFDYIFASEEFPEFANSSFNDVFGFFLSGPGINGPYTDGAINIALLPNGDPVTIDNVYNSEIYYTGSVDPSSGGEGLAYDNDMEYDGASIPLTAEAYLLWQGETYHIKLAIGDAGDHIYDSGVLFKGSSFVTGNEATGQVYYDTDEDCEFGTSDILLPNIMLHSDPGNYVAMTADNGMYALPLNMGMSSVYLTAPPLFDILCPAEGYHDVEINTAGQEVPGNDFALTSDILCPILHVNMSGYQFQTCESSLVLIEFSNEGSAPAENVTIEISLDSNLILVSANTTYTDLGNNTYLFGDGNLGIFEADDILIEVGVSCDAGVAGLTECIHAEISADNQCDFQNPGIPEDTAANLVWDHSGILVTGQCTGDSLACFTILNEGEAGNGDMDGPREYRIFANDSLVDVGTFQLNGQESTVICIATQGYAIRLEADQHPEHPGNSQPQETIEDCGDYTGNSLGYVVTTPLDDYDFDTDIWCQEVLPGGKAGETQLMAVHPKGVSNNHYVSNDAILNYTLYFQNPTDDTVHNLSIRNQLPAHLDPQTLRLAGTSHNCYIRLSKEGIITWVFRNINLPAAADDESGSKGFVSYSIKQVPMTPDDYGTEIENQASLYFDKNDPVATNISHLTFWNLPDIPTHVPDESKTLTVVNVYPNPANTKANFQLPEGDYTNLHFLMYDATGKLVREVTGINKALFSVKLDLLSTGVYYYDIRKNGQPIAQGKLMLE
ncbi:MAG: choice-of-anchor L domain-containing protein [Bacteroidota bacterium]|nr:choice-of-anchor L domain-containing protein [Bacteroidota bacterium]